MSYTMEDVKRASRIEILLDFGGKFRYTLDAILTLDDKDGVWIEEYCAPSGLSWEYTDTVDDGYVLHAMNHEDTIDVTIE